MAIPRISAKREGEQPPQGERSGEEQDQEEQERRVAPRVRRREVAQVPGDAAGEQDAAQLERIEPDLPAVRVEQRDRDRHGEEHQIRTRRPGPEERREARPAAGRRYGEEGLQRPEPEDEQPEDHSGMEVRPEEEEDGHRGEPPAPAGLAEAGEEEERQREEQLADEGGAEDELARHHPEAEPEEEDQPRDRPRQRSRSASATARRAITQPIARTRRTRVAISAG